MGDAEAAEALREASDGFFLAAEFGRSDVIKALADHGRGRIDLAAVVDAVSGRSPLHVAVAHGKTDALRVLLAAGFPPDIESHNTDGKDGEGGAGRPKRTAYALAQKLQAADLVRVFHQFLIQQVAANDSAGVARMLSAGVDVAATDGASCSSLLHWAVSCQAVSVLEALLQRRDVLEKHLVDRRNGDGATPLHLAAHGNQAECVRLLLAAGADVGLRGERNFSAGKTAAELATSPEVLKLLQQASNPSKDKLGDGKGPLEDSRLDDIAKPGRDDANPVEGNGHARTRTSTINGGKKTGNQSDDGAKHDESTCEHAAQVSRLLLQLEERDVLVNQLKKTIEDLVVEAQEIQKLGEERVMLEYVRKLREDKSAVERQLDDANDYIGVQQDQIADLKAQIRRMCDEQPALSVADGHAEGVENDSEQSTGSAVNQNGVTPKDIETQDDDAQVGADPQAQALKLDAWTPRSQRGQGTDGSGGEPWRAVWSGLWPSKESAAAVHDDDGEVIMTV